MHQDGWLKTGGDDGEAAQWLSTSKIRPGSRSKRCSNTSYVCCKFDCWMCFLVTDKNSCWSSFSTADVVPHEIKCKYNLWCSKGINETELTYLFKSSILWSYILHTPCSLLRWSGVGQTPWPLTRLPPPLSDAPRTWRALLPTCRCWCKSLIGARGLHILTYSWNVTLCLVKNGNC